MLSFPKDYFFKYSASFEHCFSFRKIQLSLKSAWNSAIGRPGLTPVRDVMKEP